MVEPPPCRRVFQPSGCPVTASSTRCGVSLVTVIGNLTVEPGSATTDGYGVVIETPAASATLGSRPARSRKAARLARKTRMYEQTPWLLFPQIQRAYRHRCQLRIGNWRDGVLLTRSQVLHSRPPSATAPTPGQRWREAMLLASSTIVRIAGPCGPLGEKVRSVSNQPTLAMSRCAHSVSGSIPASTNAAP